MRAHDLELRVSAHNLHMLEWRRALGLSAKRAAETLGVSHHTWVALENLRTSPLAKSPGVGGQGVRRDQVFRPAALKIADGMGVSPDSVWPGALRAITQRQFATTASSQHLLALAEDAVEESTGYTALLENRDRELVQYALSTLNPKEARVIRMRFGFEGKEHTLEEVGAAIGLTRERVRQIEAKALRKLAEPSRGLQRANALQQDAPEPSEEERAAQITQFGVDLGRGPLSDEEKAARIERISQLKAELERVREFEASLQVKRGRPPNQERSIAVRQQKFLAACEREIQRAEQVEATRRPLSDGWNPQAPIQHGDVELKQACLDALPENGASLQTLQVWSVVKQTLPDVAPQEVFQALIRLRGRAQWVQAPGETPRWRRTAGFREP